MTASSAGSSGSRRRSASAARTAAERARSGRQMAVAGQRRAEVEAAPAAAPGASRRRRARPARAQGRRAGPGDGTASVAPMRSRKARYAVQQRRKTCWPLSNQSAVALERRREAAEAGAPLDEHHVGAAVGEIEGGGHAGQPAADDHDARRHARPTESARAATRSFSGVGQRQPALQHRGGIGLDAPEQAAVDAGHGGHARPAAPVEQGQQLAGPRRTTSGPGSSRTRSAPRARRAGRTDRRRNRSARRPPGADRRDPSRRSSTTSRRMLVICSATPSASARGSADSGYVGAEHRQRQPADRAGDAAAVADEVVEGGVRRCR